MVEAWAVAEDGIVRGHRANTVVPWWSFTKTILAAAALALVRDGLVTLDDPLPDRPYTLRLLLQHRSGLVDYGGFDAYHEAVAQGSAPWPASLLLNRLDADRLRYEPGRGWGYSNVGYLHVRQLIETLSGEDLNSALRRLVLKPLGIETARIAPEPDDLAGVVMGEAVSYHPGWVYHGLLVGSVQDAALLLDRLTTDALLPPDLQGAMFAPLVLPETVAHWPWKVPGYGLGTMCGETASHLTVAGHTGGGPGSTVAVYTTMRTIHRRTAVSFATSEDHAGQEARAFELLAGV